MPGCTVPGRVTIRHPRRHPPPPPLTPYSPLFSSGTTRALCGSTVSSPYDQFAKDVLDLMLSAHGRLDTEVEAPALKAQRADVMFEPDPSHDAHRRALGLLGGGRPNSALSSLRFTPSPSWPRGFYDLGVALPLSIVVLSELPETSDTLAFRMMGAV